MSSPVGPGTNQPTSQGHTVTQSVVQQTQSLHVGPIPDPSDLARYDQIVPGAADRIIRMAEGQAAHAQEMERRSLAANIEAHGKSISLQRTGQVAALVIVVLGLCLATYAALNDHDWFGGAVATGCLTAIVASFLGTRQKETRDSK